MNRVAHGWVIGRWGSGRVVAAVAVLGLTLCLGTGTAAAAPGDLSYLGCISGNSDIGPAGTNACSLLANATSAGGGSGLDNTLGIAVSPDGTSVYAIAHVDDAIARFSRDPVTGALTYQDCISGRTETTVCTQIATAKTQGQGSGFDEPWGLVISPNGASVYVSAQEDDSIATFGRNATTGALTYQGCITGELGTGPTPGNGSCTAIPKAADSGTSSGIDKLRNLAIDPTGASLYATSGQDDALSRWTRNTSTGALTYVECFTAETATGSAMAAACTDIPPGTVTNGANSGFDNPQAVTVSPDGANVYVGSGNDASVTRFNRTAGTGFISWEDCITADMDTGVDCTHLSGQTSAGQDTGFDNVRGVAVSPDGRSLYAIGGNDAAIDRFSRDTAGGALTYQDCISGDSQTGPSPGTGNCSLIPGATPQGSDSGWSIDNNAPTLAIKSDGSQVFFGTGNDSSVAQLDRNTSTGILTPRRCFTSETESATAGKICAAISPSASFGAGTALWVTNGLALSPDGTSLYATSALSDAVARFSIEPPPMVVNPPLATPTQVKNKKCKKKKKKRKHSASVSKKKCKKKKKRK